MNRMAARLLERVFVKVHIRAAWNKLHNMTEQGELFSALESLIHLTATGVMVDMISTDSLGIAAPFLCHIIDMAALPSQQTTRRMSQQLLSKCDPGGLVRLRSKKKNKPAAALIWSMLANRLAGEMSSILFSDAVCNCLLNNIENDPDMCCKVFSIIALEKFSLTGPCKARIMQTSIRRLLRETANMSTYGLTDKEEIASVLQAKFCAEWSLRNIFRDSTEEHKVLAGKQPQSDQSPSLTQTENDMSARESLLPSDVTRRVVGSKTTNINVILNTLDATRHWKISEDGLSIRNDGSTFESIRATQSVTCGKWYYEVTLVTAGIMQLGWATAHCQFSPEDGTGVGDDIFGFAYDGCRRLIWADGESEPYGDMEAWKPGDVLGFYLDADNALMECFLNGNSLGPISPFSKDHFSIQATSGYYPAFSFTSFQQATVNFGAAPFKYPPALPWRNLNDQGSIAPEMRNAIVRPRGDSVYGRIQLDPVTGVRLPSMPEEEGDIDYSLLCTICCDHTATVTLQPCGHDGLCIECAYSLDMWQMLSTNDSKETTATDGLCISGLTGETANDVASTPGLPKSGTMSSIWSTEYCGPSGSSTNRDTLTATSSSQSQQDQVTTAAVAAAAAAAALAAISLNGNGHCSSTESVASFSRRRNTLAGSSTSSRTGLEKDEDTLDDPFSPPSTSYFAFLNRPMRSQRSHLSPIDLDSVDPLEMPINRNQQTPHHPLGEPETPSSFATAPSSTTSGSGPSGSVRFFEGIGPSMSSFEIYEEGFGDNVHAVMDMENDDGEDEDSNEMDVVLVEEGREASGSEVMEHSTLDFPDGHSIHSRRSSVQIGALPSLPVPLPASITSTTAFSMASTHSSPMTATAYSTMSAQTTIDFANLGVAVPGMATATVGNARFGGRRASMPSNRLEM
ncbi:RING finger and SPRY domain-containing protein 1 [Mortierella sp. GBA30]|nr:RING finger and SPRY domain-containing protein 1 [Mortierella sp. GBA30]